MGETPKQVRPHRPKRRSNKIGGTSNHKGVYFKTRSNKFVARLCLPGGKNRKLDLGEYNSHDAAACAYRVGAFYYNKPLDSGESFVQDSLPCVPDNLSDADKSTWVREQARQYATLERASILQQAVAVEAPLDHGTSESAAHQYFFPSYDELQSGALNLDPIEDIQVWNLHAISSDAMKRRKCLETRSSSAELEVGGTPQADQGPAASELRMTDSIVSGSCELRVLLSLPRTQQTAPALVMTDCIISAFQELGEQDWEVRLEPTRCDNL